MPSISIGQREGRTFPHLSPPGYVGHTRFAPVSLTCRIISLSDLLLPRNPIRVISLRLPSVVDQGTGGR